MVSSKQIALFINHYHKLPLKIYWEILWVKNLSCCVCLRLRYVACVWVEWIKLLWFSLSKRSNLCMGMVHEFSTVFHIRWFIIYWCTSKFIISDDTGLNKINLIKKLNGRCCGCALLAYLFAYLIISKHLSRVV